MRKRERGILFSIFYFLFSIFCLLLLPVWAFALDVVPGLKGFGTDTRAAYGNSTSPTIICINTLAPGTALTDSTRNGVAVKQGGFLSALNYDVDNKLIIFEVSGYIDCAWATARIDNNYVTIAGQTAPSPGITIKRAKLQVLEVHDILIQHLRIRPGDQDASPLGQYRDCIGINERTTSPVNPTYNVVVDHCSFSWSSDENVEIYQWFNVDGVGPHDITIANSIISEGLDESIHADGPHSKGLISADNNENIAIIKNLFAHNLARNPVIYNGSTYLSNNVIYNHNQFSPSFIRAYNADFALTSIGNVIIKGPESGTSSQLRKVLSIWPTDPYPAQIGEIYLADNRSQDDPDGAVTGDAWDAVDDPGGQEANYRVAVEPITATGYVPLESGSVESFVLLNAGARPVDRDVIDTRIVADVNSRTGNYVDVITRTNADCTALDTPMACCTGAGTGTCVRNDETGYPALAENTDTHNDLPANPHADDDSDGYTNLEEWLYTFAVGVEVEAGPPPAGAGAFGNLTFMWDCEEANGDFTADSGVKDYSVGDKTGELMYSVTIDADAHHTGGTVEGASGIDADAALRAVRFYVPTGDIWDGDSPFKVGMWCRWPALTVAAQIIYADESADASFKVRIGLTADELRVLWRSGAINYVDLTSSGLDLVVNTWYYVVIETDPANNHLDIYVNDVRVINYTGSSMAGHTIAPAYLYFGDHGNIAGADVHIDDIKISSNLADTLYTWRNLTDYTNDGGATAPTITDMVIINDIDGTPSVTANPTASWPDATPRYIGLKISEQLINIGNPDLSRIKLMSGPIATDYTWIYYNRQIQIGADWYLAYRYIPQAGDRSTNLSFENTAAFDLNTATMQDGDGNNLVTTLSRADIGGTGAITLAFPYPTGTPKEFSSSSTLATYLAAGGYFIANDFLECTEANSIGTADMSGSDGTAGNVITIDGGGFAHAGNQTFGDYWTVKRVKHGSTIVLGLGDTHKYSLIPSADILQVPEGATGCVISNDGVRGTLDLDEAATAYNTWITTLDVAGLAADEPVVFYNCAFVESQAAIEAKNAVDDLTFTDCLFAINTSTSFVDYAGSDFRPASGSGLIDVGYDTGVDRAIDGRGTPRDKVHDIGPYEYPTQGMLID